MRPLLEPATASRSRSVIRSMIARTWDCAYPTLAESMSCDLVTADNQLAATALPAGYGFRVLALAGSDLP
jgi:predicted nucleic acid-binding protein